MKIIVGRGRSVATQEMEISEPTVSREHCWLTDNGDGSYTLENKSPQGTFVDKKQVIKTRVTLDTYVRLGPKLTVQVKDLVDQGIPTPPGPQQNPYTPHGPQTPPPPIYSLRSLESVWAEYDRRRLEIQDEAARKANQQRLQGIFSMMGMALGLLPIPIFFRVLCVLVALGLGIYFFVKGQNSDSVQRQLHDLDLEYDREYCCPSPSCGRPFGYVSYTKIRYMKQCPACNCKYTQ